MKNQVCHTMLFPEAIRRAQDCLAAACNSWDHLSGISGDGPIREFEGRFAEQQGSPFALALSNCTSALIVALAASGVGPGDEVILPSYTWPQTLFPVMLLHAIPVFADIGHQTVTLDPSSVRQLLTPKTKAIVAVHLFGYPADAEALAAIARAAGCRLIFDAAQGFGATVKDKPVGAFGDFVAYSFGRSKLLSIGEGGMLACRTRRLFERAVMVSQHPLRAHREIDDKSLREGLDGVSFNFRMHPLIAALGIGQLHGMLSSGILARVHEVWERSVAWLTSNGLTHLLPELPTGSRPSGILVPLLRCEERDLALVSRLPGAKDVECGVPGGQHMSPTGLAGSLFTHMNNPLYCVPPKVRATQECPETEKRCRKPQRFISCHET